MSISLELEPRASLINRDHPATHAPLSGTGNRVEEPAHYTIGGSDTQAYDGVDFFLFLYLSTFS